MDKPSEVQNYIGVKLKITGAVENRNNMIWVQSVGACGEMIAIQDTAGGARFAVRVQPRARKNAITGELGDALKIALTAPPVEGRANDACIEFFAAILNVPPSSISIAAGQSSRNKVLLVAGLSAAEVRRRLGR